MSPARLPRWPLTWALIASALGGEPRLPDYPDHVRLEVVRDASGAEAPVRSAADWLVRRAHILGHVQEVMGPMPGAERRVPLDVKPVEEVDEPTYVRRKITYASEPDDRVSAWLLLPKGPPGRRPAVLCLHPTTPLGKDEPIGLGDRPNRNYAQELVRLGYVALVPDYPGFGEHKVDPYAMGYASASMKAIWDNMRGVDLLAALDRVDPDRIGAIGHSLGGHNALFTAVFDDRLKAVVSSCGFTSFPRYYGGDLAGWSHKGYMPRIRAVYGLDPKRVPFDFPELIAALAPRAFFANAPTRDDNFDVGGVKDCIAAAKGIYRLLGASDQLQAVHPDAGHDFPPQERAAAYAFLDRALR